MNRSLTLVFIGATALLLAACSSGVQAPRMTVDDTNAAIGEIQGSATQTVTSLQQTEAFSALSAISGGTPVIMSGGNELSPTSHGGLPHGHFTWNDSTFTWDETNPSESNLIYEWEYDHDASSRTAFATVEWDGSETLADGTVAPTGGTATLEGNGTDLAELSGSATYQNTTCGLIAEPKSASVSGFVGAPGDRVDFNADVSITDIAGTDTVATSGEVDAVSGSNEAGVDWDVSLRGQIERDTDCFLSDLTLSSADVDFGGYADDNSFRFTLAATEVVWDSTGATLESVDLNGSLRVDGAIAIAFTGTFDDEDNDGVPGENLFLTFADEEMTLEEFLTNEYMYAGAAAVGLGMLNATR